MNTASVMQPLLDGGIQSIKFFNGRLLSAEDLQQEQQAQREVRALLGAAIGDGIAHGFEVSVAGAVNVPTVRVEAGLAINREGDPLYLPDAVELSLIGTPQPVMSPTESQPERSGLFQVCDPPATGIFVTGRDLWILTVAPVQGTRGRAPVTGLGGSAGACNAKYIVDGVRFRLRRVTERFASSDLTTENEPKLRSLVAARCFDSDHALAFARDPFGVTPRDRLIETLRSQHMFEDCEVPLAIFYWKAGQGFGFIDRWSVRRRIARRDHGGLWGAAFSDGARAEAEALVQQFQEQIDDLSVGTSNLAVVTARAYFTHLPPVGVLPVTGSPRKRGFSIAQFFQGFTIRPSVGTIPDGPPEFDAYTVIEGSRVRGLLEDALRYPAVTVPTDEMFWIYQVRENLQASREPGSTVQPYVIFARGAVPYHGSAQYDVSHWGYATYA